VSSLPSPLDAFKLALPDADSFWASLESVKAMAGRIKFMLDEIIRIRTANNPLFASTTKTKLVLKGLDPGKFTPASPDDPLTIARIIAAAAEMGVYFK
jgi:hypothetical protein